MSPADDKGKDEVETEVVDETTLEETPVEPEAEVEVEETDADETPAEETEVEETEATEEEAAEPVAEEAKTSPEAAASDEAEAEVSEPKRSRAKKADAPAQEAPKPAAKPAPSTNGRPVVRAHAKYVRTSARKARLVADHVRGKSVTEARAILAHTPRAVAEDWEKLLNSAVANAEHNHELLGDDLRILSITADEGPTLKRFRPRAMGRASRIRKRTSHLTIALTPKEQ
jgi:ribosomal protein L22